MGLLSGESKILGNINSALMLATIHPLANCKHLLKSRDGLLVLLEVGEQPGQVVERCGVFWMTGTEQVAPVLDCFLVTGNSLVPLIQFLVAKGHVVQERPVVVRLLVLRQHDLGPCHR